MVVVVMMMVVMMTVVATFKVDDDDDGGGGDGGGDENDSGHHLGPRLPHCGGKKTCQLLSHGVAKDNRGLETFKESKPSVHHLVLRDTLDLNIVLSLLLMGEEVPP